MIRRHLLLAVAAAAVAAASPAQKTRRAPAPDWGKTTLVINVNGIQVDANGELQHFIGLIINPDGKLRTVLTGPPPPIEFKRTINGGGRTLLPGLIDGHGHVVELGLDALRLDVTGTHS